MMMKKILAVQMYLLFVSANDVADRLTELENSERRRPEEKEGKDSSEEEAEPFITCKEYKKLIKDVFKNLKKDKLLEGSKCEEECLPESKYDDGPVYEYAEAGCSEMDYPLSAACNYEFPRLMRNACMLEIWRGDGAFDENDALGEVGCGDGETYSITSYAEFETPALGRMIRAKNAAAWNDNELEFAWITYICEVQPEMCPALSHQVKVGRAMRAKRTSEESDWERRDAISDENYVRRVCIKKGRNSAECQKLLAPYREHYAQNGYIPSDGSWEQSMAKVGRAMRAKRTADRAFSGDENIVYRVCTSQGMDSAGCQQLLALWLSQNGYIPSE